MFEIATGTETLNLVKEICKQDGEIYIAVSYWSGGAAKILHEIAGDRMRVILDVNAGGTSPNELRFLMDNLGNKLRVHPNLHTKIYASRNFALIGSANATRPGLQITENNRVEASMFLRGESARSAYKFARALYRKDESVVATDEHLNICRERFGKKPISQSEQGDIQNLDLLNAIQKQPELYGHLPLILTNGKVDRGDRGEAWQEHQAQIDPGNNAVFDPQLWDDFAWELSTNYDDKICLALHARRKSVSAGLVRPPPVRARGWTFARRVNWAEVPGLNYLGHKAKTLPAGQQRDRLRKVINRLAETGQELTVWDLVSELRARARLNQLP